MKSFSIISFEIDRRRSNMFLIEIIQIISLMIDDLEQVELDNFQDIDK